MVGSRHFALDLLNAATASDAMAVISEVEATWDVQWKSHGPAQNYGLVYSQSPSPITSFAEPVVNSMDAVLMKRYREEHGETYDPATGLVTADDAVEALLGDEHDESITIIADGEGDYPNFIIEDTGEGQPREHFEERFLQLAAGSQFKEGWPFVQGRFKMGGSAVLPHSEGGLKLIISAAYDQPQQWSWSIIRNNRSEAQYEYLTRGGEIPIFDGEVRGRRTGTFVKVFEYDAGSKSNVTSTFVRDLNRVLIDPAIFVDVRETRDYAGAKSSTLGGIFNRLDQPNLQRHLTFDQTVYADFGEPFGEREVRLILFKSDQEIGSSDDLSKSTKQRLVRPSLHQDGAVFYMVNGQAHARERGSFLTGKRRCQLSYTGRDMLVFVDLSDFADKTKHDLADFVDLFAASRDRLTQKPIADQLRDGVEEAITAFEPLQEEEQRRRQSLVRQEQDEQTTEMLQSLLDRNPNIRRYFDTGDRLRAPGGDTKDPEVEYNSPFLPDEFAIITSITKEEVKTWDRSKGLYNKHQALNRNTSVQFKLNAPNDYFERERMQGSFEIDRSRLVKHRTLRNGILTLQLSPDEDAEVGETHELDIVIHPGENGPLTQRFCVEYVEPVEESNDPTVDTQSSRGDRPDLPNPIEVYERDGEVTWGDMTPPWTDQDIVELRPTGEDVGDVDLFINMDAAPLRTFVARNTLSDPGKEIVEDTWKVGLMIYSLSQFVELRDIEEDLNQDIEPIIATSMKGIAQSMLDQHIRDEMLESLQL
jgi:hypothetical protein